jgi:hypothetical protein
MAKIDPKAKAKRQKIIAGVLGLALVGVLVFQAPKIMSMFGGGSSTAASEPASTTPAPAPAPVAPVAGAPVTPAPAPGVGVPTAGTSALVDSDPAPVPADGQLVTFDRFESKDPFAPQITDNPAVSSPAPAVPVDTEAKGKDPEGDAGEPEPETPSEPAARKTATISVNGAEQDVAVGGTFPETDPIFKLVSIQGNRVRVGILGGVYANGSQTITLTKGGKPVTLMNTADGTTYVLRLTAFA